MSAACDLAYIAGFVDGEGSVTIVNTHGQLALRVCVVQTDKDVLEWIRAVLDCGGSISTRSRKGSLGKKTLYVLQWGGASAGRVLEQVLPYLRVKRGKAEVGLQFQATMTRRNCGKGVPSEVLDLRQALQQKVRS